MNEIIFPVKRDEDLQSEIRSLGVSKILFKTTSEKTNDLFVLENIFHDKGGPARHLHLEQDEFFYVLEGQFVFEIGENRSTLHAGDSIFGARRIPHVWAFTGNTVGRILVMFAPAGQMEAFFKVVTQSNAMPAQDPQLWRSHGMELLGPPLNIDQK